MLPPPLDHLNPPPPTSPFARSFARVSSPPSSSSFAASSSSSSSSSSSLLSSSWAWWRRRRRSVRKIPILLHGEFLPSFPCANSLAKLSVGGGGGGGKEERKKEAKSGSVHVQLNFTCPVRSLSLPPSSFPLAGGRRKEREREREERES